MCCVPHRNPLKIVYLKQVRPRRLTPQQLTVWTDSQDLRAGAIVLRLLQMFHICQHMYHVCCAPQIALRTQAYPTRVDLCVVSNQPARVQTMLESWQMPHVRVCGTRNRLNASEQYALLWEHRSVLEKAYADSEWRHGAAHACRPLCRRRLCRRFCRSCLTHLMLTVGSEEAGHVRSICSYWTLVLRVLCRPILHVYVYGGRHGRDMACAAVVGSRHKGTPAISPLSLQPSCARHACLCIA